MILVGVDFAKVQTDINTLHIIHLRHLHMYSSNQNSQVHIIQHSCVCNYDTWGSRINEGFASAKAYKYAKY